MTSVRTMYTVSQKTVHFRLAIILTHTIRLRQFFMVALCNRADHIYFHPVSFFFLFFLVGISVTEKVRNQAMLCFPTSPISCFCITLRNKKPRRQRTGALYVQHSRSNCCSCTMTNICHSYSASLDTLKRKLKNASFRSAMNIIRRPIAFL